MKEARSEPLGRTGKRGIIQKRMFFSPPVEMDGEEKYRTEVLISYPSEKTPEKGFPTIFYSPGLGQASPDNSSSKRLAKFFTDNGFAFVHLGYPQPGFKRKPQFSNAVRGVAFAIEILRKFRFVNREETGIVAASLGSLLVPALAEKNAGLLAEVKGIVLSSPIPDITTFKENLWPKIKRVAVSAPGAALTFIPLAVAKEFGFFDMERYLAGYEAGDIERWRGKIKCPVLGLLGRNDPLLDETQSRTAIRQFPKGRFEVLEGAKHDLLGKRTEQKLLDFFQNNLLENQ